MPDTIYVMELKVNNTAKQALDQIKGKGYAKPYLTDGRKVVMVGINFSSTERNITEWTKE
jgi:hypothetical protein